MKNTQFRFIFFLVGLFINTFLMASWTPLIHHYTTKNYAAGTQNWDIIEHTNGWMYVANNYGLLEYDGSHWSLYGIANSTALRSITLGSDGQIYVGGTDEFGVFRANELGRLQYTNLSVYVPERYRNFGEVWHLQQVDGLLYIQTRHYIFIYGSDNDIEVLDPGAIIYKSLLWEDNLYVATSRDLYVQSGNRLHALRGAEVLQNKIVSGLYPFGKKGLMIATEFDGLYLYDGVSVKPFCTQADDYIKEHQLFTIAVNDTYIALGTVRGGVVLTDLEGKNCIFITRDNGLQNNTVLSLVFDKQDNLWMGLDNGIDILETSNSVYLYHDKYIDYGSGYASLEYNGVLYMGTNQGLYALSHLDASLKMIEGTQGQVWNIKEINGKIYCCHHRGLFQVNNMRCESIGCNDGVWNIHQLNDSILIVGTYVGFYYLNIKHNKSLIYLDGFTETALYYTIDADGYIWLLTSRGVERLTIDLANHSILPELVLEQHAAQRVYSLAKLDNAILVTSNDYSGIIRSGGILTPDSAEVRRLSGVHRYLNIQIDKDSNIWYLYDNRIAVRKYNHQTNLYDEERVVVFSSSLLVGGFTNINSFSNEGVLVGGVDGFYHLKVPPSNDVFKNNIYIRSIATQGESPLLLYGESYNQHVPEVKIPPYERALHIQFSGNNVISHNTFFRTRLFPLEESYTPWQQVAYRDFTNLPYGGEYRLDVEMLSTNDGGIVSRSLPIYLQYPWYLTWWARSAYVLIFLAIISLAAYRVYNSVQASKRRLADLKNKEISQQQMRILQLENEKVQVELRNKSQELSNMLLSEANRKEWNEDVLNEIRRIVDCINNERINEAKGKIQHLQNRLARHSERSINWKRFEENFDIVNNQFVTRLTNMYPWLSKQERRLCVYIHMGLTTKEIAPLINVSARGVEMMRYRIRNKMNLDSAISLKQHLLEL